MIINENTAALVERSIAKGNSVDYICQHYGVGKTYVYDMIGGDIERYEAWRAMRKKQSKRRPSREPREHTHYRKALPPEQWEGAMVLLAILQRLKGMGVEKPTIDLEALRGVWQRKMDEVMD